MSEQKLEDYKKSIDPLKGFTVPNRWEEGIDHHNEAIKLVELIGDVSFCHYDDFMCIKTGGDGDNGEALAYMLDDLIDAGIVEIKIKEAIK